MGTCCSAVDAGGISGTREDQQAQSGGSSTSQAPISANALKVSLDDAQVVSKKVDAREASESIFRENLSADERTSFQGKLDHHRDKLIRASKVPDQGIESVADLLQSLDLKEYVPVMERQNVNLHQLFDMSSDDLKKIGVDSTAARLKILRTLVTLNASQLLKGKSHRGLSVYNTDDGNGTK